MQERNDRAVEVLVALLNRTRVPAVQVGHDQLLIELADHRYPLHAVWVGEGLPDDVASRLVGEPPSAQDVLVGHRFGSPLRKMLTARGVSWADEAGRADIRIPPALMLIIDDPKLRRAGFRWSRSAGAVAEALFAYRSAPWTAGSSLPPNVELAAPIPVSAGQVSRVLQAFDDEGWTAKTGDDRGAGAGRVMRDPTSLLSSWAAWRSRTKARSIGAHGVWRDPREFTTEVLAARLRPHTWCLTGAAAADLIAPLLNQPQAIDCYLEEEEMARIQSILADLELRPVTTGARVRFHEADPQVLTFAALRGGIPTAHPARVYADVLHTGARSDEVARHLREAAIDY